jgi:hypothetical protein
VRAVRQRQGAQRAQGAAAAAAWQHARRAAFGRFTLRRQLTRPRQPGLETIEGYLRTYGTPLATKVQEKAPLVLKSADAKARPAAPPRRCRLLSLVPRRAPHRCSCCLHTAGLRAAGSPPARASPARRATRRKALARAHGR